jgi:plasmid stability protein
MTDILLRNIPEDEVAAIDARAGALHLSRNEYIRRQLAQAVRNTSVPAAPPTLAALDRFAETFADLGDETVMKQAWE